MMNIKSTKTTPVGVADGFNMVANKKGEVTVSNEKDSMLLL
jgi:hypothetical protein